MAWTPDVYLFKVYGNLNDTQDNRLLLFLFLYTFFTS